MNEKDWSHVPGVSYPQNNPAPVAESATVCAPCAVHEKPSMEMVKMGASTEAICSGPPPSQIEATATSPDEMADAQASLIEWCQNKVTECQQDRDELVAARDHASERKWATGALTRQADKAQKRLEFYEKMLAALEAGYVIIPNFPVTAFAIRTDKKKPLKMMTTSWSKAHVQSTQALPQGEGEYKNPFPHVMEKVVQAATTNTNEVKKYWADSWRDLAFPITMAKPTIMSAATRAMALKIFDDLAILPGYSESERTRPPRGDPIIVARIMDPTRTFKPYGNIHWVTFMVAWHLNTRDL